MPRCTAARLRHPTVLEPAMAAMAPAVFTALGATIARATLPPALFEDLVSAFRQDTTVTRYATWPDLLDYCRRSANPVGRLVLRIGGWRDAGLDDALRCGLHGAAAHQLLAGPGRRLDARPALRARAGVPARRRGDRQTSTPPDHAGVARRHGGLCGPHARPVRRRARRLRRRVRAPAVGAAGHLARRHAHPRPAGAAGYDVFADRPALGRARCPAVAVAGAWGGGT